MRLVPILAVALAFVALWRCASQTRIPPQVRSAISARHAGKIVELRHSSYFGDLYDENEKWLLSPYPFADTHHIVDLDGKPIHPSGQKGIAPAGTRFVVQQIEFPDASAMAKRMLTTPRYNPWVYLTPADGERLSLDGRKAFILLLPMDLDTEEGVEAALAKALAPEGEITTWLGTRRPTVRVAIDHKDVIPGMSRDELFAAWGEPPMWFVEQHEGKEARVAWYTSKEVWLVEEAVTEVKEARAVAAPPVEAVEPEATRHAL